MTKATPGAATGTVTVSTSPTDYTPAIGTRLTIRSALPNTQPTSLPAGGPFPSAAVEQRFDQNVRLIQQLAEEVTRTIQLAVTSTNSGVVIPEPEASKFLRWDALADNLENADITSAGSIGIPVTVAEGGTGADLSGLATGALVKMNSGQTALEAAVADTDFMKPGAKGADIASASPLVLGADGNYFDVTGTTGFSTITVAVGRLFMLQFDGALTIAHGASVDLPGQADITTAAGDRLIGFATAANTVQVLSYSRAATPVDGGLPKNYLTGLRLSNNVTDAAHDIDVTAGECRGSNDDEDIALSAITKQIDAAWAPGSAAGGLSSSLIAPANNTWYHVHAIKVGGSADVGFDTSVTAANLIADHSATTSRRLGSVLTDGAANIIAFKQHGDEVLWTAAVNDYASADPGASEVTTTLTVPTGVEVMANIQARNRMVDAVAGTFYTSIYNPDVTAPTPSAHPTMTVLTIPGDSGGNAGMAQLYVRTNTSSQIQHISDANINQVAIYTMGWIDNRGRND